MLSLQYNGEPSMNPQPHPSREPESRLGILVNWLALAALLALGVFAAPARAGVAEPESGALMLKRSADAEPVAALRVATRMHATVTGNIARVEVTQTFSNPCDAWVEGLYVFPLPEGAAVDQMSMQVGERRIVGEIREREAAHQAYEKAKSEGRRASLVDQERPNMFTSTVANIAPGSSVTVSIAYLDSIAFRDGRYRLSLPLAITPRYTPGATADPEVGAAGAVAPEYLPRESGSSAAGVSLGQPPTPERVTGAAQDVSIAVELEPGFALASVESLHHAVTATTTATGRRITLTAAQVPADRDFELVWKPQVIPDTQAAAFAEHLDGDDYVLVMLTPPQMTQRTGAPREVIFIIDTSGSMGGPSIEQARAALRLGVARLGPGDSFNVIRFSDTASRLFASSVPASARNRAAAASFIDALQAGGGTEMRPALELAFASEPTPGLLRQIVFITDGSVGNESELVKLIHERIGTGRLFTVGIGADPNAYFMHAAAAAGRGSYTFISNRALVQERMGDLFMKLEQPALVNLTIRWPGDAAAQLAAPLPGDVYAGDPIVVAARLSAVPQGLLTLSGESQGHAWVRQIPLVPVTAQSGVAKLWARERIADLTQQQSFGADAAQMKSSILDLALAHHLVSQYTSLVAIDVTPVRPVGTPYEQEQAPTSAPVGSYWANSTGFARTATPAPLLLLVGAFLCALAALLLGREPAALARMRGQPR
jgi:Ca-activated chloride channel homolog